MNEATAGFLVGNTFPLVLIRRPVFIVPSSMSKFKKALTGGNWKSFWGHENTLTAARELAGVDLKPLGERPALTLDAENFPSLDGLSFRICWILSPDYIPGFRPAPNIEVHPEMITGWQVLKITWK